MQNFNFNPALAFVPYARSLSALAFFSLASLLGCTTPSSLDRQEWVKVETPDYLGALSHAYCTSASDQVHVLGGIDEYREGPFNSNGFSYHLSQEDWTSWPTESGPKPKQNFAAAFVSHGVFLFGGSESLEPEGTHDSFLYSFEEQRWHRLEGSEILDRRSRATATPVQDKIFIYGGKGSRPNLNAGIFSLTQNTWDLVPLPKELGTRVSHVAVAIDEKVFIWGGFQAEKRMGDGFLFDANTRQWTSIAPSPALGARANSRAFAMDSKVYVLGGSSLEKSIGIGAVYDIASNLWTALPDVESEHFKDVRGFDAIPIGKRGILIRGGRRPTNQFNELEFFLDFQTNRWEQVNHQSPPPGTLGGCLGSNSSETVYTLGGIHSIPNRGLEHLDGLWLLKL